MNEIGALLIEARKNQNLEIEQVSRETNIARDYIVALETDNYEIFPAEPYVLGFLRNYAEYLGLNPEELVLLYKQIKIQETTLPPDVLLQKNKFVIPKAVWIIIAVIIAGGALFSLVYFSVTKWMPAIQAKRVENQIAEEIVEKRSVTKYELSSDKEFNERLFENDEIKISIDNKEYILLVEKISPDLNIKTDLGTQVIGLGQNLKLDLNNDLTPDVVIAVEDIDKNNPESGVLVSILTGEIIQNSDQKETQNVVISEEAIDKNLGKYIVLFESGSAYPVTLNATFRGYCLFRHEADKTNREERYYQKAEQLTVQANNGFRIWASNGNVVKLQLVAGGQTVDLQVSRPGEIIVKDLKWIKDDATKKYKFIAIDVD